MVSARGGKVELVPLRLLLQLSSPAEGQISIQYTEGDEVCGNQVKASALIQLSCGSMVEQPSLIRYQSFSSDGLCRHVSPATFRKSF